MSEVTPVEAISPNSDSAQLAALEQQLAAYQKQQQVDEAATGRNAATVATLTTDASQIAVTQADIALLNQTMDAAAAPAPAVAAVHSATLGVALDVNA
jgi:hypothetical protein